MTAVKLAPPRPSCAWCKGPIPAGVRRDAISCSKRCRQARHRFLRAVGTAAATARPLRLAYADPPYPGRSARYYSAHPDYAGEVDHAALIAQLAEFDGGRCRRPRTPCRTCCRCARPASGSRPGIEGNGRIAVPRAR